MKILKMNNESNIPLYLQMYSEMKKLIQEGELAANSKLPSKKNLMQEYNLSQNTVQNALYLLMEEGYIFSIERKGYYVSNLDNLLIHSPKIHEKIFSPKEEKIKYDFSYSGVDPKTFPRNALKKITKEILEENNEELTSQGHIQGYPLLRESICRYLSQSRGFEAKANQVIISSGTEYLFHIIFKLFEKCKYGLENPGYKMLQKLFSSNHVEYSPIPLDEHGVIPEKLRKSEINVACITPSHQFPTGIIMPISRRQELLQWATEKEKHYIIEDDYDSEFKYNGRPIPSLKAIDYEDKVIYIGSFSKSISPALRLSYMVLPEKLLKIYQEQVPYFICPVSTFSQKILYKFLQEGYFIKHINRMRTLYKKKREFVVRCLKEESLKSFGKEIEIQGADAGLHMIISFPKSFSEKEFLKCCKQNSLQIYSLQSYYLENFPQQNSFLLGYANLDYEDIQNGIRLLITLANQM